MTIDLSVYVIALGVLLMAIPVLIGWRNESKMWRMINNKPDSALNYFRAANCLINHAPDEQTLFSAPLCIKNKNGKLHSVFLEREREHLIYRGLIVHLSD